MLNVGTHFFPIVKEKTYKIGSMNFSDSFFKQFFGSIFSIKESVENILLVEDYQQNCYRCFFMLESSYPEKAKTCPWNWHTSKNNFSFLQHCLLTPPTEMWTNIIVQEQNCWKTRQG